MSLSSWKLVHYEERRWSNDLSRNKTPAKPPIKYDKKEQTASDKVKQAVIAPNNHEKNILRIGDVFHDQLCFSLNINWTIFMLIIRLPVLATPLALLLIGR